MKGKKNASGPVVISLSGQLPSLPPLGSTEAGALDPCVTLEAELEELAGEQEDLEADFAADKAQQEKEEQPEDLDAFLPGWNSWTGPGVDKEKEVRVFLKIHGIEGTTLCPLSYDDIFMKLYCFYVLFEDLSCVCFRMSSMFER